MDCFASNHALFIGYDQKYSNFNMFISSIKHCVHHLMKQVLMKELGRKFTLEVIVLRQGREGKLSGIISFFL